MGKIIRSQMNNLEFRSEEDQMILEGYPVTFDSPTTLYEIDGVQYKETISRNAFDGADLSDVVLRYNHLENYPIMARTKGGSLELSVDQYGLKMRAKLFNSQSSRDIYDLVKQGGLDKMSFAFTVKEDSYNRDTRTRSIDQIKRLFDVAVVDFPAYETTSVSARSFFDEKIKEELQEAERKKEIEILDLKLRL